MDLNNIELPASAVVELYSFSLIAATEVNAEKKAGKENKSRGEIDINASWKSLGNNNKNILIMINSADALHMPDKDLNFLIGILGACKLTIADVVIINRNNHPENSYKELTSFYKSKIVFLFNIEPGSFGLPMNFPHYQIQSFDGSSFLFSPSLKDLEISKTEKTKLWTSLKRLFNL